uniref:Ovule protein n=1 Tax=Heterorhabditis bacteriophora TaxID=37862 RepID=A0A1I7XD59_HETBA
MPSTVTGTFLHMWTLTTQTIVERSHLNLDLLSRKAETDISRLQNSATEFLRTMSPLSLSVLVDLVSSFYQFYVISTCFPKSQVRNFQFYYYHFTSSQLLISTGTEQDRIA